MTLNSRYNRREITWATSLGTGQRGWPPSNIRCTEVVFVPTCMPSAAPAVTTARARAALLIPASSSNTRNAVLAPPAWSPRPISVTSCVLIPLLTELIVPHQPRIMNSPSPKWDPSEIPAYHWVSVTYCLTVTAPSCVFRFW